MKQLAARPRPDGDGPGLRHSDRQRPSARLRQRRAPRLDRRGRCVGHRHAGGDRRASTSSASGVSQALGTGGHDLSHDIGGISMLHGLRALDADPATAGDRARVEATAPNVWPRRCSTRPGRATTPVVVIFLGDDPASDSATTLVHGAATLAGAADLAVALARHETATRVGGDRHARGSQPRSTTLPVAWRRASTSCAGSSAAARSASRRSCCARREGIVSSSNTPVAGNRALDDIRVSQRAHDRRHG